MPATMKFSSVVLIAVALSGVSRADDKPQNVVEKKNVTFIEAQTSADGGTDVRREVVTDCILSLPNADELEPQISSQAIYLREVNGEANRNEWAKAYTAKLDVNYLTLEKEMLIITTRSIESHPPVIKDVEKKLRHTESFTSDPSEGGTAAGRSHREYYFTTREDAVMEVRARARVWIQQQKAVLCEAKK
jgi:hypothetical protein